MILEGRKKKEAFLNGNLANFVLDNERLALFHNEAASGSVGLVLKLYQLRAARLNFHMCN